MTQEYLYTFQNLSLKMCFYISLHRINDKIIVKNYAEGANEGVGYKIDDDAFWSDSKFSNIWVVLFFISFGKSTILLLKDNLVKSE